MYCDLRESRPSLSTAFEQQRSVDNATEAGTCVFSQNATCSVVSGE